GVARRRGHRREGAVADAIEADARGVGYAVLDRPTHAIDEVVLYRLSPATMVGAFKGHTTPARAARVDLQHGIAARCEQLPFEFIVQIGRLAVRTFMGD